MVLELQRLNVGQSTALMPDSNRVEHNRSHTHQWMYGFLQFLGTAQPVFNLHAALELYDTAANWQRYNYANRIRWQQGYTLTHQLCLQRLPAVTGEHSGGRQSVRFRGPPQYPVLSDGRCCFERRSRIQPGASLLLADRQPGLVGTFQLYLSLAASTI